MTNAQDLWNTLKWMIMSEREKINSCLKVVDLNPFIHPHDSPVPTVDNGTRCRLERIRDVELDRCYVGLSSEARSMAIAAFELTVRQRKYTAEFPMSQLHGFSNSKSNMSNKPIRVSQRTIADMGGLIHDLPDLKGLKGSEIIDACMNWRELRLYKGIRLYTDNWHRRFYWANDGGSHHMAVLCYQLQEQQQEWWVDADIYEEVLDTSPLQQLAGKVSVFVVMQDDRRHKVIFERLPEALQNGDIQKKLGVTRVHFGSPLAASDYNLVLVDHSQEYSDLSIERLEALVGSGQAMPLVDFLLAWYGHGAPDQAPKLREH
jgi:hypothetical protein